jgi:uncharacterized protein YigE (DUF2233 family)
MVTTFALATLGCKRGELTLPSQSRSTVTAAFSSAPMASDTGARFDPYSWLERSFSVRDVTLQIHDAKMTRDFSDLLDSTGATLIQNAGFFDEEGKALGLAISDGQVLSRPSPNHGGIFAVTGGVATLYAAEDYPLPKNPSGFAVQCLPRLVVHGAVNASIKNDGKKAERSAICADAKGNLRFVLSFGKGAGDGPTLKEFAELLLGKGCDQALNLDGGPSAGLAYREGENKVVHPPRGPVRHIIVVRAKAP